jgi:hypothetical protein
MAFRYLENTVAADDSPVVKWTADKLLITYALNGVADGVRRTAVQGEFINMYSNKGGRI